MKKRRKLKIGTLDDLFLVQTNTCDYQGSQCAKLKKKIPWQILFIIYHIPCRRKPRSICTCMIPFQRRALWTPDRSLRLCIYMYPYVDHNTVRLQIFIDKKSSALRTPYSEQSVPNLVSLIKGCKVTLNKVSMSRSNETRTFFKCVYTLPLALSGLYFTSTELF